MDSEQVGQGEGCIVLWVSVQFLSFSNKHQLDIHCCVIDCNYPTY